MENQQRDVRLMGRIGDDKIDAAIRDELSRQREGIELIPSENIVSIDVLRAVGSVLTNKYAEGYPSRRYYGGNQYIDVVEQLAIDRAKELFKAEHANVQAHSGANANLAVYMAVLKRGDTILGMKLDHGGHLTHGHPVNASGLLYNCVQYPIGDDGRIDYDIVESLALQHRPKLIIAGFSAYSRCLDFARFAQIARRCDAILMADIAHIAGLVAVGLHPSPFPHCDIVTTTTHKTLRGPRGGMILCKSAYAKAIDKAVFPGLQGGPLEHVIAGKAVALYEALQPSFMIYQQQVIANAKALCAALQQQGISIVSGGTENHLMVIDLRDQPIKGKELERLLDKVGIYANKNTIPHDPGSAFSPSGLRIGTPVVTTRGMKQQQMEHIAYWIAQILKHPTDDQLHETIAQDVKRLCEQYPLYPQLDY